jgi:DNA-binding CsgD family transcriptional regulator
MIKTKINEEHSLPSLSLIFGYIAVKELQRLEDRIAVLDRLGYGNAEIATICNTTPATARTTRSALKKTKSIRRKK